MRILIIRHADPDYEKDSLTPVGWKEAELLSERLKKEKIDAFYCSPLGRAQDTASLTLKKMNRTAVTLDWLREFAPPYIKYPTTGEKHISWDWLPEDWTARDYFFDAGHWSDDPAFCDAKVREYYDYVIQSLDTLLADHGYRRDGRMYAAEKPNRDTIALFCHFGLECVLLSHLLNVSPMILWHGTAAAPSSVTTLYTEERRPGKAYFRIASFGDISHLYATGEQPSFSARFCETYDCASERHD